MAPKRSLASFASKPIKAVAKWFVKRLVAQIGNITSQDFKSSNVDTGTVCENISNKEKSLAGKDNSKYKQHKSCPRSDPWVSSVPENHSQNKNKERTAGTTMSFNNSTLMCKNPGNKESYWVSFDEKSFSRGRTFKVYNGRINGTGPRRGDMCVVKVFREPGETESLCRDEIKKCNKANELAKQFNNITHKSGTIVKFTKLYQAPMDEVSVLKTLFFTGKRKLTTTETVIFEEDLRVGDNGVSRKREMILYLDQKGRNKLYMAKHLEAFAHFTYHHSKGELVLCNLEGIQTEDGFHLKTPKVYSKTQEYGNSDRGIQGIHDIFSNHVCNSICKDMIKPSYFAISTRRNMSVERCPSHAYQEQSSCPSFPGNVGNRHMRVNSSARDEIDNRPSPEVEESYLSFFTDSTSESLMPSAPPEEYINDEVFLPAPPQYSSSSVAKWILNEHAMNSFISSLNAQQFLPRGTAFLDTQMNSSTRTNHFSFDNNFNTATKMDRPTPSMVTSGFLDDCDASDRNFDGIWHFNQTRFNGSTPAS